MVPGINKKRRKHSVLTGQRQSSKGKLDGVTCNEKEFQFSELMAAVLREKCVRVYLKELKSKASRITTGTGRNMLEICSTTGCD